jgi:homoserine O-succinyltransferase
MPVQLAGGRPNEDYPKRASIRIGLINNMPDAALRATERQFLTLLGAAAGGLTVDLFLFALPGVPRTESGRRHVSRLYSGINDLWDSELDALIVTGTEPRAASLTEEPYWESLTTVLDWAQHNTQSAIWSCLAAHAAVLHFDGISRRRLCEKRFGVFDCRCVSDDPLTAQVPSCFGVPHSRWNDIPGDELADYGYRVLTRDKEGGVDAFVKQQKSLFVFFQGHPEYEANTLLREYRRDVESFLGGERETYPSLPQGYFDRNTTDVLSSFEDRSLRNPGRDQIAGFPAIQAKSGVGERWRSAAIQLYRNWLMYVCAHKEQLPVGCRV